MKVLLICLVMMIAPAGMNVDAAAPNARNYVFVEIGGKAVPLAFVTQGRFDMFSISDFAPGSEAAQGDGSVGVRNMKVYGYRNGRFVGPGSVIGFVPSAGEDDIDAVLIAAAESKPVAQARTFTTQLLKSPARGLPRKPSAQEVKQAQEIVRDILGQRKVPSRAWSQILQATQVKPVRVATDLEILIIRAPAIEIGERSLDFFLIAERKSTQYRLTMSRVHWGGITCKQDFDLFDHADLDSNGTDELIYSVYGWEWWRYWVIRREKGRWETVDRIDEQQC